MRTTHVQIYMYTYTHLYDCVTLTVHTSMGIYVNINPAMRTHMTKSMGGYENHHANESQHDVGCEYECESGRDDV